MSGEMNRCEFILINPAFPAKFKGIETLIAEPVPMLEIHCNSSLQCLHGPLTDCSSKKSVPIRKLEMPQGIKLVSSPAFGNFLVTTQPFKAGDIIFSEAPAMSYDPSEPLFIKLRYLINSAKMRPTTHCDVRSHPRLEEWSMHMLAFSLAKSDIQERVLNSFYLPTRLDTSEGDNSSPKSDQLAMKLSYLSDGDSIERTGAAAINELLRDSLLCSQWLQALATSYMALAAVPELAEVLALPTATLADAALVFVFNSHRFRGEHACSFIRSVFFNIWSSW